MILVSKEKIKKWKSYQARALKKGIDFTLTEDSFFAALHTQCYICGKNGQNNELGLDRLNNNKGYILGNIAPCCWECNKVKGNLNSLKFLRWLKRLQPKHPLLTKGHCQPKGCMAGKFVYVDVKLNPEILSKLND
jgi:hypothetical protein